MTAVLLPGQGIEHRSAIRGTSIAEVPLQSYAVTATHGSLGHTASQMSLGSMAGALWFGPQTTVTQACYIYFSAWTICGRSPTGCDFPACILVLELFLQSRCWDEEETR